jgi:hypothetical protein
MRRIFKWSMMGLIVLTIMPVLLVGATLTLFVAVLFGVPLTAPSPPVRRLKPREANPRSQPAPVTRGVSAAARELMSSAS